MGIDIYIKTGKNDFSCRLYWITNLIDRYGYEYKKQLPELILEKKLNKQEAEKLFLC